MENELALYNPSNESVVVYRTEDNTLQLDVQVKGDTVWLTQQQIAELFGVKQPAISKHLSNIFKEGELEKDSVHSIMEYTAADGKNYSTQFYNLDAILSVGYRVNSKNATSFRRWANSVLKDYMLRGYAINHRIMAIEDRIDRRLQEHTSQIHELQQKVDFFVSTNQMPVEQVFFGTNDYRSCKKQLSFNKKDKYIASAHAHECELRSFTRQSRYFMQLRCCFKFETIFVNKQIY
ncbi:MAG: virulence RhuM family protein [Paludibacteraceae bacterium]|nr:virulence RhuM family protein [Paludibacteraceae bacterium]